MWVLGLTKYTTQLYSASDAYYCSFDRIAKACVLLQYYAPKLAAGRVLSLRLRYGLTRHS